LAIPGKVKSIGSGAFDGNDKLVRIDVSEKNLWYNSENGILLNTNTGLIEKVPKAWKGNLTIPDVVVSIGREFSGCSGLTSVTIPEFVEYISPRAFAGCSNLKSIKVDYYNYYYYDNDGVLYDDLDTLVAYPEGRSGKFDVPEGTTSIEGSAFKDNKGLTEVHIPSSVSAVKDHAFEGCESLRTVTIENGISFIGNNAFSGCTSLKTIALPESLISLGDYAFSGCYSLSKISYDGEVNPCVVGVNTFDGCTSLVGIAVVINKYMDNDFCDSTNLCLEAHPDELQLSSDSCTEEYCDRGFKNIREKESYTRWKKQLHLNACVDFSCDSVSGPFMWSSCNSTEDQSYLCMNDACKERNDPISVEIDMEAGVDASDFSLMVVSAEIETLTGVDIKSVGCELGSYASIVRVVVIVDEEETAHIIADAVNKLEKSKCKDRVCSSPEECKGYICRSKSARVVVLSFELDEARTILNISFISFIVLMMMMVMTLFY